MIRFHPNQVKRTPYDWLDLYRDESSTQADHLSSINTGRTTRRSILVPYRSTGIYARRISEKARWKGLGISHFHIGGKFQNGGSNTVKEKLSKKANTLLRLKDEMAKTAVHGGIKFWNISFSNSFFCPLSWLYSLLWTTASFIFIYNHTDGWSVQTKYPRKFVYKDELYR